jgi:SPP1 family predicted phage head-tail adaptor
MSQQNRKRHRITFKQPTTSQDASGQPNVTWSVFRENEPAEFTPMAGVESMRGRQLEAGTKGVFRINYRTGYTTQMKIVHDDVEYGIVAINQVDGLRREMEVMVRS